MAHSSSFNSAAFLQRRTIRERGETSWGSVCIENRLCWMLESSYQPSFQPASPISSLRLRSLSLAIDPATDSFIPFEPILNVPALGSFIFITVIFSALIQRTNQVEEAVQDRNTALQRLRDLKSKELAGYDNVKKEDIQLLLEQYERAVLREEALRNLVPGVVRIVPPSAGSQKEEEASIIAKQLLGKEFNIGVPKRELSQNGELPVTAIWALVVVALVLVGQFVFWGWMYVNDPTGSLSSSSII
ncbi:hypothetical protein IV203_013645 [Nitzschia inconspicua]|uniref:Uncharacterized protein n=1 Tax=Nitzschia inconspicua TaxID=303405 RepID=A0A9K3M763_9STRA|nr:hypothetical protein IV203_013645 [Nitzschia inconspicua]